MRCAAPPRATSRSRPERSWHRLAVGVLAWLAVACVHGNDDPQVKDEIRAAFVYNIARFVSWPDSAFSQEQARITLCFLGTNPLGAASATIDGKELHGRTLATTTIHSLADSGRCHILMVPADDLIRFGAEAAGADLSHILTITDLSQSAGTHGRHSAIMVAMVRRNTSLGLEVDLRAVGASRVKMSSELLKLATIVEHDQ